MTKSQKVNAFWNSRADLGAAAGTNDLIAKELEVEAICKYVCDGMNVLDAGCGNGVTAIDIATRFDVHVEAFDFAEKMINKARAKASCVKLKGSVNFRVADIRNIPADLGGFDLIYTERVLINLQSWPEQKRALANICRLLSDGGLYVMCENSLDGLEKINQLRTCLDLSQIEPPWHNRYFLDAEIEQFSIPGVKLENTEYFASTYYFLSRVVNAGLAAGENRQPDYNAPVNRLALHLPSIGDIGQTRIWLWRKKGQGGRFASKAELK